MLMVVTDKDVELGTKLTALMDELSKFVNLPDSESAKFKAAYEEFYASVSKLEDEVGFKIDLSKLPMYNKLIGHRFDCAVIPHYFEVDFKDIDDPETTEQILESLMVTRVSMTPCPGFSGVLGFFARSAMLPIPYEDYEAQWSKIVEAFPDASQNPVKAIPYGAWWRLITESTSELDDEL